MPNYLDYTMTRILREGLKEEIARYNDALIKKNNDMLAALDEDTDISRFTESIRNITNSIDQLAEKLADLRKGDVKVILEHEEPDNPELLREHGD